MARRQNELRIIGGRWRGRRIGFPDGAGLRPTADRVRETLFNWLQPHIHGARCLDLFAGSGALGLEALSRGAEACIFVDRERAVADSIRANLAMLQASGAEAIQSDALRFLDGQSRPFDIVFIDPPFSLDIIGRCCAVLDARGWLAPSALIYLEQDRSRPQPALVDGWSLHRQGHAGQVAYYLARREQER